LAGAAVGAAATGVFAIGRFRGDTPRNLTRFVVSTPEGAVLDASFNRRIAISPAGTILAFNTNPIPKGNLFLRPLAELESKLVEDVRGGAAFFSPDGRSIAFVLTDGSGRLRRMSLSGGAPATVCTFESPAGGTWAADDTIYFVSSIPGGIMSVPPGGGPPREVAKVDFARGERLYKFPCALPGSKGLLFTVTTSDAESFDDAAIAAFSVSTGEKRIVVEGGTHRATLLQDTWFTGETANSLRCRLTPADSE
jgi:hypothetical protein